MYKFKVEISVGRADNVIHTTTISADSRMSALCAAEKIGRDFAGNGAVWFRVERLGQLCF